MEPPKKSFYMSEGNFLSSKKKKKKKEKKKSHFDKTSSISRKGIFQPQET